MKRNISVALFALCLTFFAACGNNNADNNSDTLTTVSPIDNTNTRTDSLSSAMNADGDFLMEAARGGLKESGASNIAVSRAQTKAVKGFAGMMVKDHVAFNEKINKLAKEKNVSVPTELPQNELEEIQKNDKKGLDFEKDYMDMMVSDHEKTVDLFKKAIADAKDEDVRKLFQEGLPTIEGHLQQAKKIRDSLK